MNIIHKIRRHGLRGSLRKIIIKLKNKSGYTRWKFRHAHIYASPTTVELEKIEQDLALMDVPLAAYFPHPAKFNEFQEQAWFPSDYHGGFKSGVWDEKLLEHWIASELLDLMGYTHQDIYVDVAAASSPWAKVLRERKHLNAFAIDLLEVGAAYQHLSYYRIENATATTFPDDSVKGVSLHCAYEMFMGQDDTKLIAELARILKSGGKAIILPLYMHTHYCAYSTPEYFGKGYSDLKAKEYVRVDCSGVPSSRKYDAKHLKARVLDPIESVGLHYRVYVLRNKEKLGQGIYCHFILEIEK